MKSEDKNQLEQALTEFSTGKIGVEEFCSTVENFINFEIDFSRTTREEQAAVKELFDIVTWFNPFEAERRDYPGFKGEAEVKAAALEFSRKLTSFSG